MKQPVEIATRAGAESPPAFAWESLRLRAGGARFGAVAAALVAVGVLGVSPCAHAQRPHNIPYDHYPQGWGHVARARARADSLARVDSLARFRTDSLAKASTTIPGIGSTSPVQGKSDSLPAAGTDPRWGWGMRDVPEPAATDSARPYVPAFAPRADSAIVPFEYLWVVRTAILSPEDVDRVVARARAEKVRGLLVQVVGRGDAYYRSDHLPRAEALPRDDFDPLDRLLRAAHAESIEVHAWMNCMLVWSAPRPPRDARHVVRAHPEWVARLEDGRALHRLTPRQRERLGLEGVFLAPAHPGARTWVAETAREIVARYPVDGIHLDYIRQPVVAVGWDPTTRARFALEAGVDPARFARVSRSGRARVDSLWLAFQCEQVRATVREVRDSVQGLRPGLPISAAVVADTITAERHNAQRWRDWLRSGLLDRAFVMCYAQPVQTVLDQLLGVVNSLGAGGRVVPGIAVYNSPPATAAAKLKGARALGFPAVAVYSYDALEDRPGYWGRLRELVFSRP